MCFAVFDRLFLKVRKHMDRSVSRASMEVVSVLLHKDSAALARIQEMRQERIAKRRCPPGRKPRAMPRESLPTQITQINYVEPHRTVLFFMPEEVI